MAKIKQYNTRSLYFPDRLLVALEKIFEYPMTIVEAPMGYGKTTAVKEYLKHSKATVLWQTVYDNYINNFWHAFSKNFNELDVECSQSLSELGVPNDMVSRREALKLIEKVTLSKETVIVIDDYYMIDHLDVHEFILFLVKNEIPNLHIVITTRLVLFEKLDELKLKGYVHHITKDELEFTADEVIKYYKLCGIHLKEDSANKLYNYTEGWVSALYLCMLKFIEDGSFNNTVSDDSGVLAANIYQLLENAVYIPLHQEIKEFLFSVCILDNFTIEEASYLYGKQNTQELLTELLAKNAFLTYDFKTKTYRMHNILTNFLVGLFEKQEISYKEDLYKRAGKWFMKTGNYFRAIDYFYLAKDFESLLEAFETEKGNSFSIEQKDLLIKYFDECPAEIKRRHPISLLVYAMCLLLFNEMELFEKVCGEFIESVQSTSNLLLGEFELLRSFTDYNDIMKMTKHLKKAWELLKKPAVFIDTKGGWTFGSPSVLYMFYRETGMLLQECNDLRESMPYYYKLTNGHGMGAEYIMEAERCFNLGEFENSEILAHKALYVSSEKHQAEIVMCALFLQARCALIKGDFNSVLVALEKMHENINREKMYSFMHTLDMCEAFIYAYLNEEQKIPEWIAEGEFHSSRLYFQARAFANIIYGRVLLIKGEYLKLLGIAEEFIGIASVFPNLLSIIYTTIYIAAANEKIFRRSEALLALRQALEISMQDKVYMPFVENGDYIEPLLRELAREGIYRDEISKILQFYTDYKKAKEKTKEQYFREKKPSLTAREGEIARLAADGFTNKEISEMVFISENTVKSQLKSIFEKLGVSSRVLLASKIPNG